MKEKDEGQESYLRFVLEGNGLGNNVWRSVESSNIESVIWIQNSQRSKWGTLGIKFKLKRKSPGTWVYLYKNVEKEVFESLLSAESKGVYFNENIKDKYQTSKTLL